jgi:predicted lipoprotein with Yx(FWY)xxD motif
MIVLHRAPVLAAAVAAVGLLAAACSSGSPAKAAGSPAGTTTIGVRSGRLGNYLVDGAGRALYLFDSDHTDKSSCKGNCLTYWPLLTSTGAPVAGTGVSGSRLATFAGPGGASEVSYAGHPLYYFALDKAAGDTKGQGRDDFGAQWWLVAPSGQPITGSSPAGTPSTTSNGGYLGGGYGG